ncbi:MAG: DUF302 domain-containing protein [Acidobacteria bacterium]|nr:DUF302 domain-containing protein [Acidobacteriota bacterium]MBW4044071.1 DUF302 domain-containing protein [Acidobacteriota bacterium]
MTYTKHSSRSPEEVETRLTAAVAAHKFGILHIHDLRQTLDSKGIQLGSECKVYDVCNPQAAYKALHGDMRLSAILPCRISIFSAEAGSVIATVKPTSLFQAAGLQGDPSLPAEVERELLAIIDEAA